MRDRINGLAHLFQLPSRPLVAASSAHYLLQRERMNFTYVIPSPGAKCISEALSVIQLFFQIQHLRLDTLRVRFLFTQKGLEDADLFSLGLESRFEPLERDLFIRAFVIVPITFLRRLRLCLISVRIRSFRVGVLYVLIASAAN